MASEWELRARVQHGVIARAQALRAEVSPKTIECHLAAGRWQRLHPGVYLTRPGEVSWLARASAAVLKLGDGAALTLGAAAYLWGLTDRPPQVITVGMPADRHRVRPVGVRVRRRRRIEHRVVRRLPVTSAAQTVIDLCAVPGCTTDEAVALLAHAVRSDKVTAVELLAELGRRRCHQHRDLLRVALGDVDDGIESVAEFLFVDTVERPHGLPPLTRQAPAEGSSRRDFESTEFGVIIEIDGYLWHAGGAFHADRRRDRRAARGGRLTLRAGWVDLSAAPCELAVDIGLTLQARGWTGRLTACGPACPVARVA